MDKARRVGIHYQGDLRHEMIEAAAAALAEVGAEQVSLRDVARRVGVSHAAPAHHFEDKTGLLTAVAVEGFELFVAHLAAAAEPFADPPAALYAIGTAYLEFADLHPGYFEIMMRPALINTEDAAYQVAGDRAFRLLRDQVAACQAQGWRSDGDLTELSISTWALIHGLALLRRQGTLAYYLADTSPKGTNRASLILTGLLASEPPPRRSPKRPKNSTSRPAG